VYGTNGCGQSVTANLNVRSVSEQPGPLFSGNLSVCRNQSNLVYKITNVPGATSYEWTANNGAVVVKNGTTNAVTISYVNAVSSPVELTVKAKNACGSSPATSYFVDVNFA